MGYPGKYRKRQVPSTFQLKQNEKVDKQPPHRNTNHRETAQPQKSPATQPTQKPPSAKDSGSSKQSGRVASGSSKQSAVAVPRSRRRSAAVVSGTKTNRGGIARSTQGVERAVLDDCTRAVRGFHPGRRSSWARGKLPRIQGPPGTSLPNCSFEGSFGSPFGKDAAGK